MEVIKSLGLSFNPTHTLSAYATRGCCLLASSLAFVEGKPDQKVISRLRLTWHGMFAKGIYLKRIELVACVEIVEVAMHLLAASTSIPSFLAQLHSLSLTISSSATGNLIACIHRSLHLLQSTAHVDAYYISHSPNCVCQPSATNLPAASLSLCIPASTPSLFCLKQFETKIVRNLQRASLLPFGAQAFCQPVPITALNHSNN